MSNNFTTSDINGNSVTFKTIDTGGGVQATQIIPSDATGTPFSSTNPLSVTAPALASAANQTAVLSAPGTSAATATAIQGVTGGVAVPVSGSVSISNIPAVQPISATTLPLPTGAATDANLTALVNAVKAQIDLASSLWTDASNAYYVRRDLINEGTGAISVTFVDPASGTTLTPGAGLKPAATGNSRIVQQALYDVTATGTNYSLGDILGRIAVLDTTTSPPTLISAGWVNLTTGAVLTTPPSTGSIVEQTQHLAITSSVLPTGAATSALQSAVRSNPGATATTALGIQGVTGGLAVPVSGAVSVSNFPATQPISGSITANAGTGTFSVSGAVSVSNFPATQPISGSISVSNLPATQAISGTVTANLGSLNGASTSALQTVVQSTPGSTTTQVLNVQGNAGGVPINTAVVSRPNDARGTLNLTANALNGLADVAVQGGSGVVGFTIIGLSGTGAVLTPEYSTDGGTTYYATPAFTAAGASIQTISADAAIKIDASGRTNVRLRISTAGSSAATIAATYTTTAVSGIVSVNGPVALGAGTALVGKVGIDQSTPGTTNAVVDTANLPNTGVVTITAGGASVAPGRHFGINCTTAGNVSVTFSDGSVFGFAVSVGYTQYKWAITAVNTTGGAAVATYVNLK